MNIRRVVAYTYEVHATMECTVMVKIFTETHRKLFLLDVVDHTNTINDKIKFASLKATDSQCVYYFFKDTN